MNYIAYRALGSRIRRDVSASLDLGAEVELTQLKLERSFEGSVSPQATANQEHCPIGELLGPPTKESKHLEYKATLRTHADSGEVFKPLETAAIKTVAAFLNSDDGGTLLLGVDGWPRGLAEDFASLRKDGKDDRDLFDLHLGQTLANAVGPAAATNVSVQMHVVGDHDVCRIHVKPCGSPSMPP